MSLGPKAPPIGPYDQRDSSAATSTSTLQDLGSSRPTSPKSPAPRDEDDTATISGEVPEGDPTDLVKQRQVEEAERNDALKLNDTSTQEEETGLQRVWRWTKKIPGFLLDQWFVLGVGFVIVSLKSSFPLCYRGSTTDILVSQGMAAAFPNVARTGGVLKAQYTIKYLLVAIIFFVSGLTLPLRNLVSRFSLTQLTSIKAAS